MHRSAMLIGSFVILLGVNIGPLVRASFPVGFSIFPIAILSAMTGSSHRRIAAVVPIPAAWMTLCGVLVQNC